MDPALKARLTSRDLWMRLVYMILFAIAYSVAELLMIVAVVFQFLFILITGSANEPLLRFGQNLTRYIADVIRFQTFNTEDKPFPFADWPDEAAGGERWRETDVPDPGPAAAEVRSPVSANDPPTESGSADTGADPEPDSGPTPGERSDERT